MNKKSQNHIRQGKILEFLRNNRKAGNREILEFLKNSDETVSRYTVVRELENLLKSGLIEKMGKGRGVVYQEKETGDILRFVDPDAYFAKGPDERNVCYLRFTSDVFEQLHSLLTADELVHLTALNDAYQKRVQELPSTIFQKELERLSVEFSWKSSHIEGNTYTLLDTELLIKEHIEAKGHAKEEAVMILNHKKALEYVLQNKERFKHVSVRDITDIHALLVENMNVSMGLRKKPVGIVGTLYKPLDNEYKLREALEAGVGVLNKLENPFSKALAVILIISYIQPFEDGNKRTSRLFGNAILFAHDMCPLSFRSVDEGDYKKAILIFYEQHSARFFKELFIQQFEFAVNHYFLA